jgi:wyosine [tRNA(Phe)-imidazoG37] synthetase (radical SAM superfamily)
MLGDELGTLLDDILSGDFMRERVPDEARVLRDIAFSGNGEPTTSPSFPAAVDLVIDTMEARELGGDSVDLTLITNGTMTGKDEVRAAVERIGRFGGRVWFKLDAATPEAMARINGQPVDVERHLARLHATASLCETWIQTCMFAVDGVPPPEAELSAYVERLRAVVGDGATVAGVLLYSLARPSHQPEAPRLSALSRRWLETFAERVEGAGLAVRVNA